MRASNLLQSKGLVGDPNERVDVLLCPLCPKVGQRRDGVIVGHRAPLLAADGAEQAPGELDVVVPVLCRLL
eukprot:3790738-Pyramimonas_sp.AAC.2